MIYMTDLQDEDLQFVSKALRREGNPKATYL